MEILAIDIETTGVDPRKDKVLEVSCVHFDDSIPPWDGSPFAMGVLFHALVVPETKIEADLNLMAMHSKTDLWGKLKRADAILKEEKCRLVSGGSQGDMMYGDQLYDTFTKWLASSFSKQNRHNVVGKNFAAFDLQFLITLDPRFETLFSRRVADPSVFFYLNGDRHLPDTQTCIHRAKSMFLKGKRTNKVYVNIFNQLRHLESSQHIAEEDARLAYLLYCIGLYRQRGEI